MPFVHDLAFDRPAYRPRHRARTRAQPHHPDPVARPRSPPAPSRWSPICCGRPGEPGAANGPARLPVSVGATLFNVPTAAVRRKIQRHSGPQERVDLSFTVSVARAARGAEACQRRYRGGAGAADRPDLPVDLGASRHAGAGHARAHHLSALSRAGLNAGRGRIDDARVPRRLALWQRGSVLRQRAGPQRALHARRGNARHVPERDAASTAPT